MDFVDSANSAYFGKKGYTIPKCELTIQQHNTIRDDLTVSPNISINMGGPKIQFPIYRESPKKFYLPKHYGIQKFGIPLENHNDSGLPIAIDFAGSLRDYQINIVNTYMSNIQKGNFGGLLEIGCGQGKTIMALNILSKLKLKTLVIVHKEFLMNQWIERINFALPDARIGIIQGSKCEIEGNDIIIGMLQSLALKDFSNDTFDDIGHVIIDECHRIPSKIFMRTLFKINCNYMLGLSATPNRKDGCTKILKWFIGDVIYNAKTKDKNIVKVDRYIIESEDENYNKELLNFRGQVQMATMVNQIVMYLKRTKMLVKKIREDIDNNENRQFLILSDRKQQLLDFEKLLKESGIESVGYYVGGMKKKDLKESESKKILLGTYPMANEGLDIPSLNGLVLATPKSDIIQTVGRISRIKHENIQPLIIDAVDNFLIFERQGKKRLDLYKKNKYEVEDIKYDLDKNEIFERKKYHYHNINVNDSSNKMDSDILNYCNEIDDNNNNKKLKTIEKDKMDELFNIFDSF